jgi:hypothetical protein
MTLQDKKAHEALDRFLEDMRKKGKHGRIVIVFDNGQPREAHIEEKGASEVLQAS